MIVQLFHNPASGTYNEIRLRLLSQAFETRGAKVLAGQTEISGGLHIAGEADLICVAGGDGSLRLVIAALIQSGNSIPVCVFPAGTVNLIAREIGYSADPEEFADQVMDSFRKGPSAWLKEPIAMSDEDVFVACLSTGPDGVAVSTHSARLKRRIGGSAYAVALAKLIFGWPRQKIKLTISTDTGQQLKMACEAFYVAKARHFAGGWALSPRARLGSDSFQLILLSSAGRRAFAKFIFQIAIGRDPSNLKFVDSITARSISVENPEAHRESLAFQIDGDPLSGAPAVIGMTDHVIEYCVPSGK